jgi:D-tyrosyl-tRNA(Tyr) deacylase
MRIVLQRVRESAVAVNGKTEASIGTGLLLLAGFSLRDGPELPETPGWRKTIEKIPGLRIFPDQEGKSNLGLADVDGEILVVSQFTLYADCRKGRRPSFSGAAPADVAGTLFERLVRDLAQLLPHRVKSGVFGAEMDVRLVNWGPVTIILDSEAFA